MVQFPALEQHLQNGESDAYLQSDFEVRYESMHSIGDAIRTLVLAEGRLLVEEHLELL